VSEYDYRVNLKAELGIRHLHEKMGHLLITYWQRLLEIQEVQMKLTGEIAHKAARLHRISNPFVCNAINKGTLI
jgi:uncharacterized membrane protein